MKSMKSAIRLFVITAVAGLALGITNAFTAAPIEQQKEKAATEARQAVLRAESYEKVDYQDYLDNSETSTLFSSVTSVYTAKNGDETVGTIVELDGAGYGVTISMTVGIRTDGTVSGLRINSHSETAGLGAKTALPEFYEQFAGLSAQAEVEAGGTGENSIETISGATVSSKAVTSAANTAADVVRILNGDDAISKPTEKEETEWDEPEATSKPTEKEEAEWDDPEATSKPTEKEDTAGGDGQ